MSDRYKLSSTELSAIATTLKTPKLNPESRLRLLCVYWVGKGLSPSEVSSTLFTPYRTLYNYLQEYHGQKKIKGNGQSKEGRPRKLSGEEEAELQEHLEDKLYSNSLEIVTYVEEKYGVRFSLGGMSKWLHRNGFRYKRPRRVPATVSEEKQEEFVKQYEELKDNLAKNEKLLFMDGVHPDHQTQPVHGWIKRSKVAQVASTGKQRRVHYMGVVSVKKKRVDHFVKCYEKIDSESVIDFLQNLLKNYKRKKLTIICDQGAYHTSKVVKHFVEKHKNRLQLLYLPPRCPNLNLIERLWKVMREHVTYNRYYKHFKDFSKAVENFFHVKLHELQEKLVQRLNDKFHIIKPVFVHTIS